MANKNFPGPNINRIIEKDPQIVKVNMDAMDWGSRNSIFAQLTGNASSPAGSSGSAKPTAPEITLKHTS